MNTVSGCLIEDNIIRESFPNIEVNHGSSGNVIAYNFIHNKNGLIGIDTNHAPHNSFNLYEGNIAHNLMSDGYYGSNSEDTILQESPARQRHRGRRHAHLLLKSEAVHEKRFRRGKHSR